MPAGRVRQNFPHITRSLQILFLPGSKEKGAEDIASVSALSYFPNYA